MKSLTHNHILKLFEAHLLKRISSNALVSFISAVLKHFGASWKRTWVKVEYVYFVCVNVPHFFPFITAMCKSPEPPLISSNFASKEPVLCLQITHNFKLYLKGIFFYWQPVAKQIICYHFFS